MTRGLFDIFYDLENGNEELSKIKRKEFELYMNYSARETFCFGCVSIQQEINTGHHISKATVDDFDLIFRNVFEKSAIKVAFGRQGEGAIESINAMLLDCTDYLYRKYKKQLKQEENIRQFMHAYYCLGAAFSHYAINKH